MSIPFESAIVADMRARKQMSGTSPLGGFAYRLDLSVPFVTTAIHAGHGVRDELLPLMTIPEAERLTEEDTATDRIIGGCPSTIWSLDSRAEYDLNRPPDLAIPLTPDMFWGTRVYGTPPPGVMNRRSLAKYEDFYRFVASLIQVLLDRHGACAVYDVHSYNIQRQVEKGHASPPVFNLGTRGIDRGRWQQAVDAWLDRLGRIDIRDRVVTVAENAVFSGLGEFCRRLSSWNPHILVLPTEISKIYMDEHTGVIDEDVTEALKSGFADAVLAHGREFQRTYCHPG
jgi:hypothetical protein